MWTVSEDEPILTQSFKINFEAVANDLAIRVDEAEHLLEACLDTGSLRTDSTRQLYIDVCKFLGKEPK